jgi:hypothetical protein
MSEMQKMVVEIADPITVLVRKDAHLDVECYQYLPGTKETFTMVLCFSPEAGAQLVTLMRAATDSGVVNILESDQSNRLQ